MAREDRFNRFIAHQEREHPLTDEEYAVCLRVHLLNEIDGIGFNKTRWQMRCALAKHRALNMAA